MMFMPTKIDRPMMRMVRDQMPPATMTAVTIHATPHALRLMSVPASDSWLISEPLGTR
ncbi:hypothetical protein [Corynebacterium xerosis]|nr:hypothetical protein [Corynebacterium xerosis]